MTRKRLLLLLIALLLVALSWFGVVYARIGLVVRQLEQDGVPMLYISPISLISLLLSRWQVN